MIIMKKKNDYNNDSKTNISAENDESQKSDLSRLDDDKNKPFEINIEQDEWDNSFEDDFNKINEIIDKLEYSTLVDY